MKVPVRMPRIAASGVRMRVDSVAVRTGSAVRAGDVLLALHLGELPVTLHAEIIGVVKDIRADAGAEVLADRVILWLESPDPPPIRSVAVAGTSSVSTDAVDPSRIVFRLPAELLATHAPVVRKLRIAAGDTVQPNAAVMEVGLGPVRFEWSGAVDGVVDQILVKEGDSLRDGTVVAHLAGAAADSPKVTPRPPAVPPPLPVPEKRRETEIPELTLVEFQATAHALREKVLTLADMVSSAGLANSTELLRAEAARLADPRFSIAVVGEFKRGKSSFLNALAGGNFLPNDVIPCTAFACRFQYGEKLQLATVGPDGQETISPLDTQPEIGAELDRLTRDPNTNIREAIVRLPLPLCRDGVDLIDTPGLNDSEAMNRVTLSVLPNVDTAVLLLIPESPLSETERQFLQDHLLGGDVGRLVFVLNAKDRVAADKLPRLMQYLKSQIDRILAERDAAQAPFHAVSAKLELDHPGGEESGFVELRRQLSLLLFRQRGRLILSQTLLRTGRAASEALVAIKLRLAQVATSRESFQASLDEVARQIATARLHANAIRRRIGDAQAQASSIVTNQARYLYLALAGLRDSLPRLLTVDVLKVKTTDEVKAQLTALLQLEAGKLYQQALTKLMTSTRGLYDPIKEAARSFADEVEHAFATLAGNVYQSAVGMPPPLPRTTAQLTTVELPDMSGGLGIQVDLSLGAMSWLLLVESSRDLLSKASFAGTLAGSLEARAIAKLREDFGNEIERQVRAKANETYLAARLFEIVRRPFDSLMQSFNQEMKVLLDDSSAILASLQATAAGQGVDQSRRWHELHEQIAASALACENVVFQSTPAAT